MNYVGSVTRVGKSFDIWFISMEELNAYKMATNTIAFKYKDGRIFITPNYLNLSKCTRSVILQHEIYHAMGNHDEIDADKSAILAHGEVAYINAVRESMNLMRKYSTKTYTDLEFNHIVNSRFKDVLGYIPQ